MKSDLKEVKIKLYKDPFENPPNSIGTEVFADTNESEKKVKVRRKGKTNSTNADAETVRLPLRRNISRNRNKSAIL